MDLKELLSNLSEFAKDSMEHLENGAQPSQQSLSPTDEREKTDSEWEAYFKEILQGEFPSCTIRENVPVTDLVGFATDEFKLYSTRPKQAYKAEWGQPYTFVVEDGGKAKAVLMLGKGHSHVSNVKYLIARMYAKKLGLPYINFYTQMPNERDYVIGRIHQLSD